MEEQHHNPVLGPPPRSREQRMLALRRANDIRSARKLLKETMHALDSSASAHRALTLLREPPADTHSMKVADLLGAIRGVGHVKRDKILKRVQISPSKTLVGLTGRQRADLARQLRAQHGPMRKERAR